MKTIITSGLTKNFHRNKVLKGVSFEVDEGTIFGIIGPDGAGKSTLIRTLATLINPDGGKATLLGLDLQKDYRRLRKRIGYMPENFSLYQDLSVEENLEFYASLFNTTIEDSYALIEPVFRQLAPFKKRRAGKLSGGMKQKLALSCALIHQPELLILDEPTRGVDPLSRMEFWNILADIKRNGTSIVLTTSYMDEASLCDNIGLFYDGVFLQTGTPQSIISNFGKPVYEIHCAKKYATLLATRNWAGTESCYSFGNTLHMLFKERTPDIAGLKRHIENATGEQTEIIPAEATVEDCFMNLINS